MVAKNEIVWKNKARKQLRRIDRSRQRQIKGAVDTLADMPHCKNVKKLSGHQYDYRLRVGDYRVLFDYFDRIRIVSVEAVKKRDEQTY